METTWKDVLNGLEVLDKYCLKKTNFETIYIIKSHKRMMKFFCVILYLCWNFSLVAKIILSQSPVLYGFSLSWWLSVSPCFISFPFLSLSACCTQGPKHPLLNSMLYLSQMLEAQFLSCHLLKRWATLTLGAGIKNHFSPISSQNNYTRQERWLRAISLPYSLWQLATPQKKRFPTNEGRATPVFRAINPQHYSLFLMDMGHQQANYNQAVVLCL